MTNKSENTAPIRWRVDVRTLPPLFIEARTWSVDDDGFIYFTNGGNGVAAAFARTDVVAIVDLTGEVSS